MMQNLPFSLEELAQFLVKAKRETYAGDGREVAPERPGFKELEYSEGDWSYRDSYAGFFMAPGQEVVRFRGEPVWAMAYVGGMSPELLGNVDFARRTFKVLKLALSQVEPHAPFRGQTTRFVFSDCFLYLNTVDKGNICNFRGHEKIACGLKNFGGIERDHNKPVFEQDYIGGLIVPKIYRKAD